MNMHFLYNIIIHTFLLAGFPVWLLISLKKKYREGLLSKLGFSGSAEDHSYVMVHGVSVGEINASYPFIQGLIKRYGKEKILITSTTQTGFANARKIFPGIRVDYFPFDFYFSVFLFFRRKNIAQIFLMETEIWPNFCYMAAKKQIPLFVLNARISDNSYPRFLKYKSILQKGFMSVTRYFCQSKADGKRLLDIGVLEDSISISGFMKVDTAKQMYYNSKTDPLQKFPQQWARNAEVIMGGSLHVDEIEQFLKTTLSLFQEKTELKILVVPRKPAGIRKAVEYLTEKRAPFSMRSELTAESQAEKIIIVDTMGELFRMYAFASIVFIGKSLHQGQGGQNPLEPAVFGKAVIIGPSYENFRGIVDRMSEKEAIIILKQAEDMQETISRLLSDSVFRKKTGKNAEDFIFNEQSGCDSIFSYLDKLK